MHSEQNQKSRLCVFSSLVKFLVQSTCRPKFCDTGCLNRFLKLFRNSFQHVQCYRKIICYCYAQCPSLLLSLTTSLTFMTFPSLGEIVIFAKGKQPRKLKPLASSSRELPANPQLIQTQSLWSLRWKAFFWEQKRGVLTERKKKAAAFTHLRENSGQNIYWSISLFSVPGGHTLHQHTSLFHMLPLSGLCDYRNGPVSQTQTDLVLLGNYVL